MRTRVNLQSRYYTRCQGHRGSTDDVGDVKDGDSRRVEREYHPRRNRENRERGLS